MAVSSGIYSLAGVLIGGGITTAAQVHLDHRRERRTDRADERALRAARREVGAELYESAVAARVVWEDHEAINDYLPLLGRTEKWERHASLLADDECYLPVRLAFYS